MAEMRRFWLVLTPNLPSPKLIMVCGLSFSSRHLIYREMLTLLRKLSKLKGAIIMDMTYSVETAKFYTIMLMHAEVLKSPAK